MNNRNQFVLIASAVFAAAPVFSVAGGNVTFFTDQNLFEGAAQGAGKFQKGVEDFEASTLAPNNIVGMDDPLDTFTDNDWFNPGDIEPNFRMQSNLGGNNSGVLAPRGPIGLALQSAGFQGTVSDTVVANIFVDSCDLIFLSNDKTAVGFDVIRFSAPSTTIRVDVYNTANVLIGTTNTPGDPAGTFFLGVLAGAGQTIGRINLFDVSPNSAEGADNIQMWTAVPEPGTFIALGAGLMLLSALRRRK